MMGEVWTEHLVPTHVEFTESGEHRRAELMFHTREGVDLHLYLMPRVERSLRQVMGGRREDR